MTYEVLATLSVDAARKRMSVVVRSPHTNKVYLMVKGADDAVYQRLADNDANASRKVRSLEVSVVIPVRSAMCVSCRVVSCRVCCVGRI